MTQKIPGPPAIPLLSPYINFLPLARYPAQHLRHLHHTYGDIVSLARGTTRYVLVFSPGLIQTVLSKPALFHVASPDEGPPIRLIPNTPLYRLFANGLNQMNEPRHQQHRRIMQPAFHKQILANYRQRIITQTETHIAAWQQGQTISLLPQMRTLTASIAIDIFLGLNPHTAGTPIRQLLTTFMDTIFSPPIFLFPFNIPATPYRRLLHTAAQLETFLQDLITQKRASMTAAEPSADLLATLLTLHDEDGTQMTDAELVGQTATLFIAGHETTATALTWTLFLLAQHPAIYHELMQDLSAPLLNAIIKESLRLLPPLFFQVRNTNQPVTLGPHHIPAHSMIGFSSLITHRHPTIFPNPQTFNPHRWLDTPNPSPYAYFPFSAGPRLCLGAPFATLELETILPLILQKFRPMPLPQTHIDLAGFGFLIPKGDLPMRLHPPQTTVPIPTITGQINDWLDLPSI
ncbi:MAG TPA: cytochrome P450 [Anaerolineae bacterium]|nr:cytochrome P450 [Anaerolineae bacterium]